MDHLIPKPESLILESLSGQFSIECSYIELAQSSSSGLPVNYCGPGTLSLNNGEFIIKVYSSLPSDGKAPVSGDLGSTVTAGRVIPDSEYFKMTAIAHDGERWSAEQVWIDADINHDTRSMLISGSTYEIEQSRQTSLEINFCRANCLHQNFKFPCSEFSNHEFGRTRNKSTFTIDNISCSITIKRRQLEITMESKESFRESFADNLIEALQIATGQEIKEFHRSTYSNKTFTRTLHAHGHNDTFSALNNPLPNLRTPWGLSSHVELLSKLIPALDTQSTPHFAQYFRDLITAYRSGIEASALAFSVAVEGMASRYFKDHGKADKEFAHHCSEAIPLLEELKNDGRLQPRVADRVIKNLQGAGAPTTKNILYKLFEPLVADKWNLIRHPAAHGSLLDKNLSVQQLIDCTMTCKYMYYSMLCAHLKYEGPLNNLTKDGHPSTDNEVLKNISQ